MNAHRQIGNQANRHAALLGAGLRGRALRSGELSEFERVATDYMGNSTIEHRVLALMLEGETTVAEAMKLVSWAED